MKKTFVAMLLAVVMALTMVSGALAEDTAAIKVGLIGPMTGDAASWAACSLNSTCRMTSTIRKCPSMPIIRFGTGARR